MRVTLVDRDNPNCICLILNNVAEVDACAGVITYEDGSKEKYDSEWYSVKDFKSAGLDN